MLTVGHGPHSFPIDGSHSRRRQHRRSTADGQRHRSRTGCGRRCSRLPLADHDVEPPGHWVSQCLQVKEVRLDPDLADDRFVVCYNPAEAERDAATRARHVAALTDLIDDTDTLPRSKRDELAGVISTRPHLKCYLRRTPGGLLRVDQAAIARETNLDGKYLLRTSDPTLSTEDIALGYKQRVRLP